MTGKYSHRLVAESFPQSIYLTYSFRVIRVFRVRSVRIATAKNALI